MSQSVRPAKSTRALRKPGTRDKQATKAALIAAAEQLFAAHGFSGATLDMLAAEAGCNKALVSYYFGSKEGLYDAVIESLVGEVVQSVRGALGDSDDTLVRFRAYIAALARSFAERPTFPAILMREYISGSVQEREAPFRQVLQFYQITNELYRAGRREKLFRNVDPHQLHLSIVAPLIHFVLTMRVRNATIARFQIDVSNPAVADFASHHAALLIDGLKA